MRPNLTIAVLTMTAFVAGCAPRTDNGATSAHTPTSPSVAGGAGTSTDPLPSPGLPGAGGCDASQAQWALHQRATDDLLEKARVAVKATVARFVRHDEQITLEYMAGRLTIFLDSRRDVRSVGCG